MDLQYFSAIMDDNSEDGPLTGLYRKVDHFVSADDEEQEQEQYDYSFSSHQIGKEASHPNQHSTFSCSERGFTFIAEKSKNLDSATVRTHREKTVPKLMAMCYDALRKERRARLVLPGHLTRLMAMVHPEDGQGLMKHTGGPEEAWTPRATRPAPNSIADEGSEDSSGTTNMAEGDYGETVESSLMVFDLRASSSASVYGNQAWRPLRFLPNTLKSIPDRSTTCKQVHITLRVHLQSRRVVAESVCVEFPAQEAITGLHDRESQRAGSFTEDKTPATRSSLITYVLSKLLGFISCCFLMKAILRGDADQHWQPEVAEAQDCSKPVSGGAPGGPGCTAPYSPVGRYTTGEDEDKTPLKTDEREIGANSRPDTTDMAVQVNWLDRTDKGVQVNLLDMKASERGPSETDFPQPQTSLGIDAAAGGGVQDSGLPMFAEQIPRGELAAMRPERADLEDAEARTERSTGLACWDFGEHEVLLQYQMAERALQDNLPTGCTRHSEPIVDFGNFVLPIGGDTDDDHSVLKKNQAKIDVAQPPQQTDCKPSSSERKPFKSLTLKDTEKYGETYPADTDADTMETFLKESAKRQPVMKSHEKGGSEDEETLLSRHYSASRILPGFREWVVSMLRSSGAAAGTAGDGKSARCDADFRSEWRRLATFDQYQPPKDVFVLPIAHNGFFLLNSSSVDPGGLQDSVECAFCGVTVPVRMFQRGRVEEVHRRASPDCGFLSGRCRGDNVAIGDSESEGRPLEWMAVSSQGAGPVVDTPSLPRPSLAPSLQQQTEVLQTDSCPEPADSGTDLAPAAEAAAAADEARGHPDGALLISTGSSKPRPDHSAGRPPTHNSTAVPTLPQKPNTAQPRPPASSAASSNAIDASATTPSSSTSASTAPTTTTTTSTPPPAASSLAFSSATSSAAATAASTSSTASTATSTATPSVSAAPSSRSTSAAAAAAAAPAVVTSATTSAAASATQSGSLPPISGDSRTQSDNLSVSSTPATIEAATARVEEGSSSSTSQGQRTGNQGTAAPPGNPDARSSTSSSSSSSRSGESGTEGGNGSGNGEGSSTENETERQVVTYEDLGIFAQQPKRPDLAVTQIRINTFDQWPHQDSHPADQMAEAGFYYTGHQDLVRCFFCKGGLKTWERSDQPWVEHCRWFPRCPFVRLAKGQRFVDVVQTLNSAANQPTISEQQVIDEVNRLNREERRQAVSQSSSQQAEGGAAATVDPVSEVLKKEGLRDWVDIAEDGLQNIVDRLEDEQDDIRHDTLCKVCQSGDVNVLFLPCGHLVTCAQCAPALKRCAMCRQPVKGSVRVRMDNDLDDGHDTQEEGADTRGATSTS